MRYAMTIAALAVAGNLFAGGFFLQLGNPEASAEARNQHAVLTIRAYGCHDPASAQLTATAVGMVDGHRQSIPLKVTNLSEPGLFALAQQWPRGGRWVVVLTAKNDQQFTNTLVYADERGIDRLHAKADMKPFPDTAVDAMLQDATR